MTGPEDDNRSKDGKKRRLRSIAERLPERGPLDEEVEVLPRGPQHRITWPVAFVIATIVVCLTVVYILSRWPEWQCKREGGIWYPASENLPDNFCDRPGPG